MTGTVVILTALDLEFDAMQGYLTDISLQRHETGTLFAVGNLSGSAWRVALAEIGDGNRAAAVITEQARQTFEPEALLFVGVAGAVKDDIGIGDVVVATKVSSYQGGKDAPGGFLARPQTWDSAHALVQAARHALRGSNWLTAASPRFDAPGNVRVHFKPIGAGDVVLNSPDSPLKEQLQVHYNDVAAVEMESAGMAHAAHIGGVDVLTVRGISDKADGKKYASDDARNQPRAARLAAAAAVAILRSLPPRRGSAADRLTANVNNPSPAATPGLSVDAPRWLHLTSVPQVRWRSDLHQSSGQGSGTLEIHLIPNVQYDSLQVRHMERLADELASLGRSQGFFSASQAVKPQSGGMVTSVLGVPERGFGDSGLAVTRQGQRSAWTPLPRDDMGGILDRDNLPSQIRQVLGVLVSMPLAAPKSATPAIGLASLISISEGSVGARPRNTRSISHWNVNREDLHLPPEEALSWRDWIDNTADIADELAARLIRAFRSPS